MVAGVGCRAPGRPGRMGPMVGSRRPGLAFGPLALVVSGLLAACGAPGGNEPAPSGAPATPAALAVRLTQVIATDDRAGFDALFVTDGTASTAAGVPSGGLAPATGDRRDLLWTNLHAVGAVRFVPGLQPDQLRVSWTVAADDTQPPAWQVIRGVTCGDHGCGLLDLAAQSGAPAPLWAVQRVSVDHVGRVSVLAAAPGAAAAWRALAEPALATVDAADLTGLTSGAPGELVVEAPASFAAFEAVLGTSDATGTGALTWIADSGLPSDAVTPTAADPASQGGWVPPKAAVRVVVNPTATAPLSDAEKTMLLAHEAVHVVTAGRPAAPGRTWVAEGVAEQVALTLDAGTRDWSRQAAQRQCGPAGLPPPPDAAFHGADAAALRDAYAVSWQLVTLLWQHEPSATAEAARLALWDGDAASDVLANLATWSVAWCQKPVT